MSDRIGVFICGCGPNIRSRIDIDGLLKWAVNIEAVACAETFDLLCAEKGQLFLIDEIREKDLTRIVIAGCTPKEHEKTFRRAVKKAGLNPYLLQIANVREQCAWVTHESDSATERAKRIILAAVKRVSTHEPLEEREIECNPDVMVVGAGVAGLSAATTLAQQGRTVHLVESQPCIGGKAVRYDALFPDETCAACILEPMMDNVLNHPGIRLATLAEPVDIKGYFGNFTVTVRQKPRYVDPTKCLGCEACVTVCPVTMINEFDEALNRRKAITIPYGGALPHVALIDATQCLHLSEGSCDACRTECPFEAVNFGDTETEFTVAVGAVVLATGFDLIDLHRAPEYGWGGGRDIYHGLEFERMVNADGPTEGEIRMKSGQSPRRIALLNCAGSRSNAYNAHCSGICCMYSLKFIRLIREKLPDTEIFHIYADWCFPVTGAQAVFNRIQAEGRVRFSRMASPGSIDVLPSEEGIRIAYTDATGEEKELYVDMAVLASSMEGSAGGRDLAERFGLELDSLGFFVTADPVLAPISTSVDGIYVAGCAKSPMNVADSIAQGQAAAGNILQRLIPGEKIPIEPLTAEIDESQCAGCRICIGTCRYGALCHDDKRRITAVNDLICRGCGVCAAACPAEAIGPRHFKSKTLHSEIEGLLKSRKDDAF